MDEEEDWILVETTEDGDPAMPTTFGTAGKDQCILEANQEVTLFDYEGSGCMTHFWFGGNFDGAQNTRIRYYVDSSCCDCASIGMALYLGHGIGFGDDTGDSQTQSLSPFLTKWMGKVGRQNGVYNNYRIPFSQSVEVTAERIISQDEDEDATPPPVWYYLRGTTSTQSLCLIVSGFTCVYGRNGY